jgi:hypothetical protein
MTAPRHRQIQQPDSRPPEPLSPLELALVQALARVVVDRHLAAQAEAKR